MNFEMPVAERRLRNTSRLVNQSMWLLLLIAAALIMVVRRSAPARAGSVWIFGFAVIALMASFALRDMIRKVGHRNTEDRIVKDVKTFLESEPALSALPVPVKVEAIQPVTIEAPVPSRAAGFVDLKEAASYCAPSADPVVFDALPLRAALTFKADFFPVLLPVK